MKQQLKVRQIVIAAAILVGGTALAVQTPRLASAQVTTLPNATLDLQDAPIRAALEQLFRSAKVDFSIDPAVQGFVNLKITDRPFESALKLILRSGTVPLTYAIENGVYLVKPRTVSTNDAPPPAITEEADSRPSAKYETIELIYADPADLSKLLNITMIPIGTRFGLNVPGGSGIITPGGNGNNGPDSGANGNNRPSGPGTGGPGSNRPGGGSSSGPGTGSRGGSGNGGVIINSGGIGTNPGGGRIGF